MKTPWEGRLKSLKKRRNMLYDNRVSHDLKIKPASMFRHVQPKPACSQAVLNALKASDSIEDGQRSPMYDLT